MNCKYCTTEENERLTLIEIEQEPETEQFVEDVRQGLTSIPKRIPSHYLYDKAGYLLFEEVCGQPEYYLRAKEEEIVNEFALPIINHLPGKIALIELGSGNSKKTRTLIEALLQKQTALQYVTIDVSREILHKTSQSLVNDYPKLTVLGIATTYEEGIPILKEKVEGPKLILWLGSSLGQMYREDVITFLRSIRSIMNDRDRILIGIDMKKDESIIAAAYGLTNDQDLPVARFLKNILVRINRELAGEFNLNQFERHATYNPLEGRIEAKLISCQNQRVKVKALPITVEFHKNEAIDVNFSHKYSTEDIQTLAQESDLELQKQWLDAKQWFSINLFRIR